MSLLRVILNSHLIGHIRLIPGDRTIFEFTEDYLNYGYRDRLLSLSLMTDLGKPEQPERSYQRRLPPLFSNLLPEGALRTLTCR